MGLIPQALRDGLRNLGKVAFMSQERAQGSPHHLIQPQARARHTLGAQYMLVAFQVKAPILLNEGVSLCCPLLVASSEASGK